MRISLWRRIRWWVVTLTTDRFWWFRFWMRLQRKCFMCEKKPETYGPRYGDEYVCMSCAHELTGVEVRGPVSYCCICGGMGGRDGSLCWGCQ